MPGTSSSVTGPSATAASSYPQHDLSPRKLFDQGSKGKKMTAQRPPAMPPAHAPSLIQWPDLLLKKGTRLDAARVSCKPLHRVQARGFLPNTELEDLKGSIRLQEPLRPYVACATNMRHGSTNGSAITSSPRHTWIFQRFFSVQCSEMLPVLEVEAAGHVRHNCRHGPPKTSLRVCASIHLAYKSNRKDLLLFISIRRRPGHLKQRCVRCSIATNHLM